MAPAKKATTKTRRAGSVRKAAVKKAVVKGVSKKIAAKKVTKKKSVKKATKKTTQRVSKKTIKTKTLKPAKKETLLKKGGPLTFPRVVSLSLFTPLVPINPDQIAIGVARFGGAFFVLAGALFAFLNLQAFNASIDATYQSANIISTTCEETDLNCVTDRLSADMDPWAEITVKSPSTSDVLTDTAEIVLETEFLHDLKVAVYDLHTGEEFMLGPADPVREDGYMTTWVRPWDTQKYPDGEYVLLVYAVTYDEFPFSEKSGERYVIENHLTNGESDGSQEVHTDTSSTDPDQKDTGTVFEEVTGAVADIPSTPNLEDQFVAIQSVRTNQTGSVSGTVQFSIHATQANYIKLSAKNTRTLKTFDLGRAYERTSDEWYFKLDSTKFDNDEYSISVMAVGSLLDTDEESLTLTFNNTDTDLADSTATEDSVSDTPDTEVTLLKKPTISLYSLNGNTLSDDAGFSIKTKGADYVEVYALPVQAGTKQFLGLARQVDDDLWKFQWNTYDTPNGEYEVTAHVRNNYGYFVSEPFSVKVSNVVEKDYTETEEQYVKQLTLTNDLAESNIDPLSDVRITTDQLDPFKNTPLLTDTEDSEYATPTDSAAEITDVPLMRVETVDELNPLLQRLAVALRADDTKLIAEIKKRIQELKSEVFIQKDNELEQDVKIQVTEKIDDAVLRVEKSVEITERIVKERTGKSASTDSDNDGITDFDEINLYQTDPFAADTDGDGFTDGAEILNGYDPKDARPETLVVHESPKESGILREDILKVEKIIPAPVETDDADGVPESALITGRALPNSFITLYIFSTPIIITVKTEADGTWAYKFDKELEDGEHEIYIGMTDNAGKIVAKSEPLRFVKEAQAFTPVDVEAAGTLSQSPQTNSFASQSVMLIILSISVVAIGLVLILLGLHLSTRPKEEFLVADDSPAPAV